MTKRAPAARVYLDEIIVDSFAGGGGASKGIEMAIGRSPDIAINHDAEAIALHRANHPDSTHYTENVWHVDPKGATKGRPVGLMWLSPDCKHFSKAKGGKPVSKKIRGLAWVAIRWAVAVKPRVIVLENVEEFQGWGPVLADGKPCPKRKGKTFRAFVRKLERLGYAVEWKEIRACDYGAPTIRKRLFLIARRDGQPIVWPKPTHGKDRALPWRTAAECIDWTLQCPSIFNRNRPLKDNTMRRIARGIQKFVIDSPRPFIVGLGGRMSQTLERHTDQPMQTICSKADSAIVAPFLKPRYGEDMSANRRGGLGQAPRVRSIEEPMPVIVPTGNGGDLVATYLAKHNGGNEATGQTLEEPMHTIAGHVNKALTVAHLTHFHKSNTRGGQGDLFSPMRAVLAGGNHIAEVRAFLVSYYGTQQSPGDLNEPTPTIRSKESLGLVQVEGREYTIADIGMRMLQPRELYRAQGFPESYKIDIDFKGKPMTKTAQVRMCGNSVCPPLAAAIIEANYAVPAAGERVA